jgi:hypothetical protein
MNITIDTIIEIFESEICPVCKGKMRRSLSNRACYSCDITITKSKSISKTELYSITKDMDSYIVQWYSNSNGGLDCRIIQKQRHMYLNFSLPFNITNDKIKTFITFS